VVPYLRSQGVGRIDKLIVSHGDNDHIGGVPSVLKALPVAELIAGIPELLTMREARQCRRGERWRWEGVAFSVLHPDARSYRHGNNASCVVRVETEEEGVLPTGDIEADSERYCCGNYAIVCLRMLIVPHTQSDHLARVCWGRLAMCCFRRIPHRYRLLRSEVSSATAAGSRRRYRPHCDNRGCDRGLSPEAHRSMQVSAHWRAVTCATKNRFGCCDK
jgi:competence protein ComEC